WRFSNESKLSDLAKLINQGDGDESWQLMNNDDALGVLNPKQTNLIEAVLPRINKVHNQLIQQLEKFTKREQIVIMETAEKTAEQVNELFKTLKSFQSLSAHRRGFGGSMMLNAIIDKELIGKVRKIGSDSLILEDGGWYVGRP